MRRHMDLDRAARTRLPLTLERFERASGLREMISNAREYRQLLVAEDPVRTLSEVCEVRREKIEALRAHEEHFVEYTFLHRQYHSFMSADSPLAQVRLTLDCVKAFIEWTHGPWSKTVVCAGGSTSFKISILSQSLEELSALVQFIDDRTAHSTSDPQAAVTRVLECLDAIWGMPVPETVDEYLQMRCRSLSECMQNI